MSGSAVCLAAAGAIGLLTALIHGIIMQRHMIKPLGRHLAEERVISRAGRALLGPLLHVSTLAWSIAGLALLYAALAGERDAQQLASAIAFVLFGHATIANAAAVRALHPGWILMALATALIVAAQL